MNIETALKTAGAAVGAAAAFIFPTPILITMLYCLAVVAAVDALTGISKAIEKKEPVTPKQFIEKSFKKAVRGVSYLALAWVSGTMIGTFMPNAQPVAEPVGLVLGMLIVTDALSVIRNLAAAKNNIPLLDKYFKSLLENLRAQADSKSEARKKVESP